MPGNFAFVSRFPFLICIVFVCFSISTGFPILVLSCFLSFLIMFLVEKKIFISFCKKPPLYTDKISKVVMKFMLFALLIHCLFAIYIYGEEDIFPNSVSLITVGNIIEIQTIDNDSDYNLLNDLLRRAYGSPLFCFLTALVVVVIIFDYLVDGFSKQSMKTKFLKNFEVHVEGSYFDNFSRIVYNDMPQYDFRLSDK